MFSFLKNRDKRKKKKEEKKSYRQYPALAKIKAREKYVFHSDYFQIDDYYATIMMFKHQQGARDGYGPFWGVNMIPNKLPKGVTTMNVDSIERMTDGWLLSNQTRAEKITDKNKQAQDENGTMTERAKVYRSNRDLVIIAQELTDGASYLNVKNRLLVKAPSLEVLDKAVGIIEREFTDRFGTLSPAQYNGRQNTELYTLLAKNGAKYGQGFYYTSTEFAGNYNLVTHGLEDPHGEYVGYMTGDVNNSAVLFDVDNFNHHIVVSSEQVSHDTKTRQHISDMWGVKLAQAALLDNHRVVHIILDTETNLNELGPALNGITQRMDMYNGDVNMFEMFGPRKDQLAIYSRQMQKLVLMTEQAYDASPEDKSIIENFLKDTVTNFYVTQRMWVPDAQHNLQDLRLVGIPHDQIPKLETFKSYLDMAYQRELAKDVKDPQQVTAANVLRGVFSDLLSTYGDLFNVTTSNTIDRVATGQRVVYDFGNLLVRGKGVAMAQLVNILDYALSTLRDGDLVIIHGAEKIDKGIRKYCSTLFSHLYERGGRIAFLYNDNDAFLRDSDFNHFDQADYTILGNITNNQLSTYEEKLGSTVPADLANLITKRDQQLNYIRRDTTNVVFVAQIPLRPNARDYGKKIRRHY